MTTKKDIVLYCDYGLDDAVATVHILNNREKFNNIYIVPIGGNQPTAQSRINAKTLLAACSVSGVTIVDTRQIVQPSHVLVGVHGKDGMGDFMQPSASTADEITFAEFAAAYPKNVVSLVLGPCTVPSMIADLGTLYVMGGAVRESGNEGVYEFNEALDLNAFALVAPRADGVATLDTCRIPAFDIRSFDTTADTLFNSLIKRMLHIGNARPACHYIAYDYVAALAVTNPERFTTETVTTHGVTYKQLKYIGQ